MELRTVSTLPVDAFELFLQRIQGLPGERHTRPATIVDVHPLTGVASTHLVQSYRLPEGEFTVLLQRIDALTSFRLVLPDKVVAAIARQRTSLVDRSTPLSRARKAKTRERVKRRQEQERRRSRWVEHHNSI